MSDKKSQSEHIERKWMGEPIPEDLWGRDHISTLLYVETRCVDQRGKLCLEHLRKDGYKYSTRLANGVHLVGHTDLNCIDDFETAGLIENRGTGINPLLKMTDKGWEKAHTLRRERAERNG